MKLPGLAGPSLNPPANFLNPAAERTLQGLFGAFGPLSTVQVVGDVYLDVIAKIDALPEWDGDSTIKQPIETVAGGSALNTAVQLSALLRVAQRSCQPVPPLRVALARRCRPVRRPRRGEDPRGGRRCRRSALGRRACASA